MPAFIEALPQKISAIVGQNLELRCYAASEDLLDVAYVWYHNGLRLQTTQNVYSLLVSISMQHVACEHSVRLGISLYLSL